MRGGASIVLMEQSKKNMFAQMDKLKKTGKESMMKGIVKILFDIKALAQLKLKYDQHIVTSRLRNSIYVQTKKGEQTSTNDITYTDNTKKSYSSKLDIELNENEGAVGTNVNYAEKIEFLYDSFLYWAAKNVDLNKRWREVSKDLLGINK
jgi:hypothetical protein